MSADLYEQVKHDPNYKELVTRRSKFSWTLAIMVMLMYFIFILTIAFVPNWLAIPVSEGSVITIGIPIGIAIILLSFILTGIYVHKANTDFDRITANLIKDLEQ